MPEPSQVHVDTALTSVSVAYHNADFVASRIATPVSVRKQSDRYYIYDSQRETLRPTNDTRAPGAVAGEVDFQLSTDSYFCDDHALVSVVPDEERQNADPALQPDIDRTEFLTQRIMLNAEIDLETKLRTHPDIPQLDVSAGTSWTNPISDPLAQIKTARHSVLSGCNQRANTVVLATEVYEVLRDHPAITDRIRFGSPAIVTEEILAQLFDVDRVIVARAYRNNATKGQAPSVGSIWGESVFVMHIPKRPGLKQVAPAYTFLWNGTPGSRDGALVDRWRDHSRKADIIRVQRYHDQRIVAPTAAYRLINTLS